MPRTTIPTTELVGPANPALLNLNNPERFTNALAVDNAQVLFQDGLLVIVQNRGLIQAGSIIASANKLGRSADAVFTCPANGNILLGPFKSEGWRQSDGYLYIDCSDDDLWFFAFVPK